MVNRRTRRKLIDLSSVSDCDEDDTGKKSHLPLASPLSSDPAPQTPKSKNKDDNEDEEELSRNSRSTPRQSNRKTKVSAARSISSIKKEKRQSSPSTLKRDEKSDKNAEVALPSSSMDLILPNAIVAGGAAGGECTVMVQIDPKQAMDLDFHGASGAIGRFEADCDGVTMDLKGYQYTGILHPGPTMFVASMHPKIGTNTLKIECVTDEFVTLVQTANVMDSLDAIVEKGDMDKSYRVLDDNVNLKSNGKDDDKKGGTGENNLLNLNDGKNLGKKRKSLGRRGNMNLVAGDTKKKRKR